MNTESDAATHPNDSTVGSTRRNRKVTPAQRHKYNREIAIYRGMFGGTDVAKAEVKAWAAGKIASFRPVGTPDVAFCLSAC